MYKEIVGHGDYYNRHDELPNVEHIATLSRRDIQSAEQNELQCVFDDKIKALGRSIYVDGTVIEGCDITLDPAQRIAHMGAGRAFIDGHVRPVEAATLEIPGDTEISIGIWLHRRVLTEDEDRRLLNPALLTPGYLQAGAYRVLATAEWGLNLDNLNFPFYPIYTVSGGEIVSQIIREKNQDYLDALARYDRSAHGHYVDNGLRVTAIENLNPEDNGKKQTYSIGQGLAHIEGFEARLTHAVRLVVDEDANLYEVVSEAHQYDDDGSGKSVIPVHQTPIESIKSVRVTKEKTVTLVHGSYTGCSDPLPDTSVIKIVSVVQGGNTFATNTYRLDANKVNWEPDGDEPAPGSTYQVTYHYRSNVTPDESDYTSMTLSGLVDGSLVEIDYTYRMPRLDIIVMYRDRSVTLVKGIPHRFAPVLPKTPPGSILLATVEQTWTGLPIVKNVAIQAVRMDTLAEIIKAQRDQFNLSARNELRWEAVGSAPSSAFGVFADPLLNDDMRDAGTPQTAAIMGEELQLPMDVGAVLLPSAKRLSLDYGTDTLTEQLMHTKSKKVNEYMTFTPLPAIVTLSPAIDRWTDTITTSISGSTRGSSSTFEEDVEGALREITVRISAVGYGYGEPIRVFFDGVEVLCTSEAADEQGKFEGTFVIPKGIPTGTKSVLVLGEHTPGSATFTGIRTIERRTVFFVPDPPDPVFQEEPQPSVSVVIPRPERVNTPIPASLAWLMNSDPLAQTFTPIESRHVAAFDFWLAKKGTTPLRIEIRGADLGMPNKTVYAMCQIAPDDLKEGEWNRGHFNFPALLTGGVEYAIVVMTNDAVHELGIVELGDWDPETGWVRSQQHDGVLLSGANNSTWTPHQGADMTFRLLGAVFAPATKHVELAEYDLTGITDVMVYAEVQRTAAEADATFVLAKEGVEVARMQAGQLLSLTAPLDGVYSVGVDLFGSRTFSPILGRDPQMIVGEIHETGDYVSRAFRCGANRKIMVTIDAITPGTSAIDVYVLTGAGTWTKAEIDEADPIGDKWFQQFYYVPCGLSETKIKIVLTGSAAARPRVKNIRGVVLGV